METLKIKGGVPLRGRVNIEGAKNAVLPLMAAAILQKQPCTFERAPHLTDVRFMQELLGCLGVGSEFCVSSRELRIIPGSVVHHTVPRALAQKMRASILLLAPLVSRQGLAEVPLPGGCAIGLRPVDLHLKALRTLGAEITLSSGCIRAQAPRKGLTGNRVVFPFPSVGATESVLLAAALARGETYLSGAAREPEVVALGAFLQAAGVQIEGLGTPHLYMQGRQDLLEEVERWKVIPDRIEAGSYAVGAAITNGDVVLSGVDESLLDAPFRVLRKAGVSIRSVDDGIHVTGTRENLRTCNIETGPYPGFPTDLQAQFMVLMCLAQGRASILETVFENRFGHVPELQRMHASISLQGARALVHGACALRGADVVASDLRGSMCLVLAALAAEGETRISCLHHLDRGYAEITDKLALLGADVCRLASSKYRADAKTTYIFPPALSSVALKRVASEFPLRVHG